MSALLPANAQPAMMGLDRATQYQAQAVMATSMQQTLWYASLLDGQLLVPARFQLHYWTLMKVPQLEFFDETTKSLIRMEPTEIRQAEFALVSSQPLMGIDRLRQEIITRDLVNILFQAGDQINPVTAQFLRYYVQVGGATLDMTQFEEALQKAVENNQARVAAETAAAGPQGIPPDNPAPAPARAPITAQR